MATTRRAKAQKEQRKMSARKWADKQQGGFERTAVKVPEGVPLYKPKAGTARLSIVPYTAGAGNPNADEGEPYFERLYHIHYNVGPNKAAVVCPARTFGERCPICDYRTKVDADGDEELAKSLWPKDRNLFLVFDHDEPEKGIQLWDVSFHLFTKELRTAIMAADEDETEWDTFAEADESGGILKITFADASRGGLKFVEAVRVDCRPRKKPLPPKVAKHKICLDDLLIKKPYDELKALFLQTQDADTEEDEDTPAPKGKGKVAKRGKAQPEPEEEEDELEDEEPEDDEDWNAEEDEDEEAEDEEEESAELPAESAILRAKKDQLEAWNEELELGIKTSSPKYKRLDALRAAVAEAVSALRDEEPEEEEEPGEDEDQERPANAAIRKMSVAKLRGLVDEWGLDVDPDKHKSAVKLAAAVIKAFEELESDEEPEDEEDEDEVYKDEDDEEGWEDDED